MCCRPSGGGCSSIGGGATLDQDPPRFTVTGWVDAEKETELKAGSGKTAIFTDRVE